MILNKAKDFAGAAFNIGTFPFQAVGGGVIKSMAKNPMKSVAAVGTAAALTYTAADMSTHDARADVAGTAALGATAALAIPGAATVGAAVGAGAMGVVGSIGGMAMGLGDKMLKVPNRNLKITELDKVKFTGFGKAAMLGSGLVEGAGRAVNKFYQSRMGQHDGQMRKSAPMIPQVERRPSYENNGGATGDLVFSMYNNRQG